MPERLDCRNERVPRACWRRSTTAQSARRRSPCLPQTASDRSARPQLHNRWCLNSTVRLRIRHRGTSFDSSRKDRTGRPPSALARSRPGPLGCMQGLRLQRPAAAIVTKRVQPPVRRTRKLFSGMNNSARSGAVGRSAKRS